MSPTRAPGRPANASSLSMIDLAPDDPTRSERNLLRVAERALGALFRQAVATEPRAYAVVLVGLALLFVLTVVVAGQFHQEREHLAASQFERGRALARAGDPRAALVAFRAALALERDRPEVELALALALLDLGRAHEAVTYLADVLRADPTNGPANLARARAARTLGEFDAAEGFYQRAIYGAWPPEAASPRLAVRFELVELLLQRGQHKRAVGELTQIDADAPDNVDVAARLGPLFLQVGAADRAAAALRRVVTARPGDAGAWAALAAADMALGQLSAAVSAGQRALALRPDDEATSRRVETARLALGLDPTARRLATAERERRARALVMLARAALLSCVGPEEGLAGPDIAGLDAEATALLGSRPARHMEAVEAALGLAERLWARAREVCPAAAEHDVLALALARAAGPGAGG
jgi:tetratricopeptide (TPR) repeat protein